MDQVRGARLCYGKPVSNGSRTVIPVARVFVAGGLGFGHSAEPGSDDASEGGGGGGTLNASPVGFIEIDPEGARFRRIGTVPSVLQLVALVAGSAAAAGVAIRRAQK